MSESEPRNDDNQATQRTPKARLARNLFFYTVLRLLMVVLLTAVVVGIGLLFSVRVPILVAGVVAVVVALPLSMMLFTSMRTEINSDIATLDAERQAKRDNLRRRMSDTV